jgi:hypothetical protein
MKTYITVVKIKCPWWIRWAKRFMSLEAERHHFPVNIKGQTAELIIVDEVGK